MSEHKSQGPEPLMMAADVARYLGIAEGTVRNKASKKQIPFIKVGASLRFRRSDIDRWLETQTQGASA